MGFLTIETPLAPHVCGPRPNPNGKPSGTIIMCDECAQFWRITKYSDQREGTVAYWEPIEPPEWLNPASLVKRDGKFYFSE